MPRKESGNPKALGFLGLETGISHSSTPHLRIFALSFTILLGMVWMSVGCWILRYVLRDLLHASASAVLHRFQFGTCVGVPRRRLR